MKFTQIENKKVALLLWHSDEEVYVHLGEIIHSDGQFIFVNQEKGWIVELLEDELSHVQEVPEALKADMLDADFALLRVVQDLPDDADFSDYIPTGITRK